MAKLQLVGENEVLLDGVIIGGKLNRKISEEELGTLIDAAIEKAFNVCPISIPDDPWRVFACLIIKNLKETLGDVTVRFETDEQNKKYKESDLDNVQRFAGSTNNTFFTMCCYVKIKHNESHCPKCNGKVLV